MSRQHRIVIATLCTLALLTLPGWVLRHENAAELEAQADRLAEAEARNEAMAVENQRLFERVLVRPDDAARIEHEVRQRLGWVRAGEIVVDLAGTEPTP